MSNSQEQSLNENVIFTPLTESNPEYLHCERERYCLESLISAGSGAFYTKLNNEQIGAFLSSGEVKQITSWAEDYHVSDVVLEDGNPEEEVSSDVQDFSGHYFPVHSDTPAPCLELGWPERTMWMDMGRVHVYTNPPAENAPPIREILRRMLQGATKLIALVTDRLSDCAVIGDLHCAASRGIPVYIILNRRSVEENSFPHRLQHPNIRVRVLGGKIFLSREGRMVVGELKDNFVLVDLETVMLGSYSLTWTDAHLHRQIVTVMSGPVVESFDYEFRILYAASLPIPDIWKTGNLTDEPQTYYKTVPLNLNSSKVELTDFISSPPPPPPDCILDWEEMGVIQRFKDSSFQPPTCGDMQFQHRHGMDKHAGGWGPPSNEYSTRMLCHHQDESKLNPMFIPEFRHLDFQRQRPMHMPERLTYNLHSAPMSTDEDRYPIYKPRCHRNDMEEEAGPGLRRDPFLRRESNPCNIKKPHPELTRSNTFSTLSDIIKRVNSRKGSAQQRIENPGPGVSKSTMDLNLQRSDTSSNARTSNCDNLPLTPALALMKKRNDEIKSGLLRSMPNVFAPAFRNHGSAFGLQREAWRSHLRSHRSEEEH